MTVSLFDNCDDSCGWTAAVISTLAYGSFGVPIKETVHVDAHPLVLQTYKTGTMFLTCWFVLAMGVPVTWTPWGLVSGLLWVLGGSGGIYAIRMAGMAIAVGTWASVMIAVNFTWGFVVFKEPVADFGGTISAFLLLTIGLVGMSHFSAPPQSHTELLASVKESPRNEPINERMMEVKNRKSFEANDYKEMNVEAPLVDAIDMERTDGSKPIVLFGRTLSARQAGILGAIFNGLMTGSSLVPLHFAKKQGFGGARYMISFASGALIANALVWAVFVVYLYRKHMQSEMQGSLLWRTYASLPGFHFRQLWLPGFAAGMLLTIAMFGAIISTTYLGQGIGNSVIQAKILVSGLWGIFWYKEITGVTRVTNWFIAASITVIGIFWLSQERLGPSKGHRTLLEYDSL